MSLQSTRDYVRMLEQEGHALYAQMARFRVKVPCGKSGPWIVRKFTPLFDLGYMRFARDGRAPGLGEFTALNHKDRGLVMSDTIPEVNDFLMFAEKLRGHVLITGLGLGMALHILTKIKPYRDDVQSITVIEKDRHVIKLTGEFYRKSDKRIRIINADAFSWVPPKGVKFDSAWHDIWDTITNEERRQMGVLRVRYRRYVKAGQQFCWGQEASSRGRFG